MHFTYYTVNLEVYCDKQWDKIENTPSVSVQRLVNDVSRCERNMTIKNWLSIFLLFKHYKISIIETLK